jgi:hypothetical protein
MNRKESSGELQIGGVAVRADDGLQGTTAILYTKHGKGRRVQNWQGTVSKFTKLVLISRAAFANLEEQLREGTMPSSLSIIENSRSLPVTGRR